MLRRATYWTSGWDETRVTTEKVSAFLVQPSVKQTYQAEEPSS